MTANKSKQVLKRVCIFKKNSEADMEHLKSKDNIRNTVDDQNFCRNDNIRKSENKAFDTMPDESIKRETT